MVNHTFVSCLEMKTKLVLFFTLKHLFTVDCSSVADLNNQTPTVDYTSTGTSRETILAKTYLKETFKYDRNMSFFNNNKKLKGCAVNFSWGQNRSFLKNISKLIFHSSALHCENEIWNIQIFAIIFSLMMVVYCSLPQIFHVLFCS